MLIKLNSMRADSLKPIQETVERLQVHHIHDICTLKDMKLDSRAIYRAITQVARHLDEGILEFLMPDDEVRALWEFLGAQSMMETYYIITELDLKLPIMTVDRALFDLYHNLPEELREV